MPTRGTKLTYAILSEARTIEADVNGKAQSIGVQGFLISNDSGALVKVTITDNDGTALFVIDVNDVAAAVGGGFSWDTPFIANNGMKVTCSAYHANQHITVIHTAAGF